MDSYEASQSLANDLLSAADSSVFRSHLDTNRGDTLGHTGDILNEPGLWSEEESEVESDGDGEQGDALIDKLTALKDDHRDAVRFKRKGRGNDKRKGRGASTNNQASFELQEAQGILEEIIRIDSNVFAAWQTLGEVHKDRGKLDKCLTAWMTAAHLHPKNGAIWEACALLSVQMNLVDQADYCYNRLTSAMPKDVNVFYQRAFFNKENDRPQKAIDCFKQVLMLLPFEMSTVRELARLYSESERFDEALQLYEDTSEHYIKEQARDVFTWSELNIMAELHIDYATTQSRSEAWRTMISSIKSVARWLRGRQFETFWNDRDDDAEWDSDANRRKKEEGYVKTLDQYAYDLPLDLRIKLGRARLHLNNKAEAMKHFELLADEIVEEVSDLFVEVGDALLKAECWEEALQVYSKVTDVEAVNSPTLWTSMAKAFRAQGEYEQAEECLEAVHASDPRDADTMVALAEVYELQDKREAALEMINNVIELRKVPREGDTYTEADDFFTEIGQEDTAFFEADRDMPTRNATKQKQKRTKSNRRAPSKRAEDLVAYEERKTEETRTRLKKLELSREGMLSGHINEVEQWMSAASDLIDEFRSIRYFYPSEKKTIFQGVIRAHKQISSQSTVEQLQGMVSRLEDSLTRDEALTKSAAQLDEFRGVAFKDWLELFLQYSLLLVRTGDALEAFAVLDAASAANVFYQNHAYHMRIRTTKCLYAMIAGKEKACTNAARQLIINCLFRDDAIRIFAAGVASGYNAQENYRDSANQKFFLRVVKTMDGLLSGVTLSNTISVKDIDSHHEHNRPGNSHPVILILYGHLLQTGKSYNSALQYFIRAHALCPEDPILIFSLGLSYLHRSMQRQSDNRHLQVMQALSLLLQYQDLRTTKGDAGTQQETQYNLGRALHQIGLVHLALPYYERALNVKGVDPQFDLVHHIAYNMQLIYVLAGRPHEAQRISEEFLTI